MISNNLPVEHDEMLALPFENDPIYNGRELFQVLQRESKDALAQLSNKHMYHNWEKQIIHKVLTNRIKENERTLYNSSELAYWPQLKWTRAYTQ